MEFRSPATTFSGTQTYTLDLSIPADQRIPITDIEVIIEQRLATNSGTGLAGKLGAPVILRVKCPMQTYAGYDCPTNNALAIVKGGASATDKITGIEFVGPFISQADADAGTSIIQNGYFGSGTLTGTYTGYGYDNASTAFLSGTGYGYGYQHNNVGTFDIGAGNGYGYGSQNLLLRFKITLSGGNIGAGHYFMTVEADTGSATIGRLSSKFTEFDVAGTAGGSSGAGAGATTTAATTTAAAAAKTVAVTATAITPPAGADSAFQTPAASANSGDTLAITIPGATSLTAPITLLLTQALTNAQVTVAFYTPTGYAGVSGSTPFPAGTAVDRILEITVSTGGGTVGTITIPYKLVTLPSGATEAQGVLMRLENGAWVAHGRMQFTRQSDGTFAASGSAPCCSVFAVAFDTEAPTVALTVPTGNLSGIQTLTATAADNLQLLRVEFWVDDQKLSTDTSAPYEFALDTATLTNGEHTIKAVAYDFVENSAEDSEMATTNNADAPGGPGEGEGGRGWVLWLIVGLIVVALVVLVVTFAGRKPKAP